MALTCASSVQSLGRRLFGNLQHCYLLSGTTSCVRGIFTTQICFGEPLKKKRRLDPAVIKAREERKRKKLDKEIRRLGKQARQFKPIDELEVPKVVLKNPGHYKREASNLSKMEEYERDLHEIQWTHYKTFQHLKEMKNLESIISSQTKALKKLREESEDLYVQALECDSGLIPYMVTGPVLTPPNVQYKPPDGDITDESKIW